MPGFVSDSTDTPSDRSLTQSDRRSTPSDRSSHASYSLRSPIHVHLPNSSDEGSELSEGAGGYEYRDYYNDTEYYVDYDGDFHRRSSTEDPADDSGTGPHRNVSPRAVSPDSQRAQPDPTFRTGVRLSFDSAYEFVIRGNQSNAEDRNGDDDDNHDDVDNHDNVDDDDVDDERVLRVLRDEHASLCESARTTLDNVFDLHGRYASYLRSKGSWFQETVCAMLLERISSDIVDRTHNTRWMFMEETDMAGLGVDELLGRNEILTDYIDKCYYQIETGEYLISRGPSVMEIIRGVVPFRIQSAATRLRDISARFGLAARYIICDPRVSLVLRRDGRA